MSRLVLVGAGHAHMTAMSKIREIISRGHTVTVIGPGEDHFYSGMGPGMLGGNYTPREISFPVMRMCEELGARFILDSCTGCDPEKRIVKLKSGREIPYDVASFNTGSSIINHVVEPGSKDVFTVKPIENLLAGRRRILELATEKELNIGVVGGGPAGVEVAGNAAACARETGGTASVRLYCGKHFMKGIPPRVRKKTRTALEKQGVEIIQGAYVKRVSTQAITLEDGNSFQEDIIFVAMGVKPRPLFEPSGIPAGPDGGMLVNRFLQSPKYPDIFGGGDCIWFEPQPLNKVGVFAVRENPVLYSNILARMEGTPLTPFNPGGDYLLIFNTGNKTGVLHKNGLILCGRTAFTIKDYIDVKFMERFRSW